MLSSLQRVVPPFPRARGWLGNQQCAEQHVVGRLGHASYVFDRMRQMLEHLEGSDQVGRHTALLVETAGEKVLAKRIVAVEVEAAIAHKPDEDSVAAAVVEKASVRL